jgi:hypothetical protein
MEKLVGFRYINCKKLKLKIIKHWICGSHGGVHEEYHLLGCDIKYSTKSSGIISKEHTGSMFRVKE